MNLCARSVMKKQLTGMMRKRIAMSALSADTQLLLKNLKLLAKPLRFRSSPSDNKYQNND